MTPGQAIEWLLVGVLGCIVLFVVRLTVATFEDVWRSPS